MVQRSHGGGAERPGSLSPTKAFPQRRDQLADVGRQRALKPQLFATFRMHNAQFSGVQHDPRGL
jgi:hypothetical protein